MRNKILLFIILLLSGCFECCSIAYGANLVEVDVLVDKSSVLEALIDNLNLYTTPIYSNTFSTFENKWNSSSSVVCMFYLNSGNNRNYCRLVAGTSNDPLQPTTANITMTYYMTVADMAQNTSTTKYLQSGNSSFNCGIGNNSTNVYYLYLDNNGNWWEYSEIGFSVGDLQPPFNFVPNYDIKNNSVNVLKRSYSVIEWELGKITDLGDYDYYVFDLHAANEELDTIIQSKYDHDLNRVSGRYIGLALNGDLFFTSRLVLYDLTYRLNIQLYKDNSLVTQYFYLYKFLPLNSVLQNTSGDEGIIVSVGSGDYNVQNSTNDILNNLDNTLNNITDSSEVDNIMNEYLSGDIESIASDFGFSALDNPYTTFLLHVLESTYDSLTLREDVVLQANYRGITFRLNSADFTTPSY